MLAITVHNGTSIIDPASFKGSSGPFPVSSSLECSAIVWSPDGFQLYLAASSSIKRYTPSECLLEELYCGTNTITCLAMRDNGTELFFAAANEVWALNCTHLSGKISSSLQPHKKTVTSISLSNDGTLLASVSASGVFVHNLTLSSYAQLGGLPDRKAVKCCLFHQHAKTRLLLGVGRDVMVYDAVRPSRPLKTIRVPGGGDIMGIAASPFSKTLVAVVTSSGDVALVDLDKDVGILKTVNLKTPLTCCSFTAEGAAMYLGAESGKLLILDLRALEKVPRSFTIGDGNASIREINVLVKSKSHLTDTSSAKVKSSSISGVKFSPQRSASSARTKFVGAVPMIKSPVRITVASRVREGGGVTPKKKSFSPVRTPLSETKNSGPSARLAASSSLLSRRFEPLRLQRDKEQGETRRVCSLATHEPAKAGQCAKSSLSLKMGQAVEHLGLGSAPESISGHLAALRVRSNPRMNSDPRCEGSRPKTASRRIISETVESACVGRKLRPTSSCSLQSKVSSSKEVDKFKIGAQQTQERRPATPGYDNDRDDMSSPELPREPVTPVPLGKNAGKAPLASAAGSGVVLGLTSPEVAEWVRGESQRGKRKEKVIEMKKARFAQDLDAKESSRIRDESEHEGSPEILADERCDEEQEQELSLQVSPRRPTAIPTWLQSPHRPLAGNLNVNIAAQDFLRSIVHDVMYDFQRETKAEMRGLHLDLLRMGNGWKQELREIMEECNGELRELKAENKQLKEENERLRGVY